MVVQDDVSCRAFVMLMMFVAHFDDWKFSLGTHCYSRQTGMLHLPTWEIGLTRDDLILLGWYSSHLCQCMRWLRSARSGWKSGQLIIHSAQLFLHSGECELFVHFPDSFLVTRVEPFRKRHNQSLSLIRGVSYKWALHFMIKPYFHLGTQRLK